MAVLQIAPAFPDAKIPRAHPCTAFDLVKGAGCGVTPADQFLIICSAGCRIPRWLCTVHWQMVLASSATCRECAVRWNRTSIAACLRLGPVTIAPPRLLQPA